MARSLKLKNNDFWDSSGVVDGTTPLNTVLNNIRNSIEQRVVTGVEIATNEWIDNKRVYRRRIDCGNLISNGTKEVNHGLSNINFVEIKAVANENRGQYFYPIPYVSVGILGDVYSNSIGIAVSQSTILIVTARTLSVTISAIVDLYYTKNN